VAHDSGAINGSVVNPAPKCIVVSPRLRKQGIGPLSNLWQDNLDPRTGTLQDRPTRITNWSGFTFASPTGTADGNVWRL